MKIEINITKDVLRRSMWCQNQGAYKNCAVAYAVREIWPRAMVMNKLMGFDPFSDPIWLPQNAVDFILLFDSLETTPEARLELPEFSFEIDVPEQVIERIGIQEARAILEKSETLKLIEI